MAKIKTDSDLKAVILQMENRKALQEQLLKEQFQKTYKSLKPINIIKSTIKEAVASQEIQDNVIETVANVVAGFLSKKIMSRKSEGDVKKYMEKMLQYGITTVVVNNADTIRTIGECFISSFLPNKKKETV